MLALEHIDKHFGATHAVHDVSLIAETGSVLGLVGENGAGKSTLLKIASGVLRPDRGGVVLDGIPLVMHTPTDALARGISSVFQELTLIGPLSVEENLLLLERFTSWTGRIDRRRRRAQAERILGRFHLPVHPGRLVRELPLGLRQMLEIVRALHSEPRVLLLDEATAALSAREVDWLARLVSARRDAGQITLFISHRWDEVTRFCDRVAIMRNGELVHLAATAQLRQAEAVRLMAGRALAEGFPQRAPPGLGVLLRCDGLWSTELKGVSFVLAPGEILGLGGLVGQGQEPLLKALFGARPLEAGSIAFRGRRLRRLHPSRAMRAGVAYVPQERKSEGLLLTKSIAFNLTLPTLKGLARWLGFIDRTAERQVVAASIEQLRIQTRSMGAPVDALSGGNQQKVMLAKWLLARPALLLLNDVTRGVDIATKQQIYRLIIEVARQGTSLILYSTDTNELAALAHRILVMLDGAINRELSGEEITVEALIDASITKGSSDVAVA